MSETITQVMPDSFFKELTEEEAQQFVDYAEANPPRDEQQYAVSHPVCREVWDRNGYGPPFGDVDESTLDHGKYRLRRDVINPNPDRRKTSTFSCLPVWKRGTLVQFTPGIEGGMVATADYYTGAGYGVHGFVSANDEGWQDFINALERVPFTPSIHVPGIAGSYRVEKDTDCGKILNRLFVEGRVSEEELIDMALALRDE